MSEAGRAVCLQEAAQAPSPQEASKRLSACLEGIDARLNIEKQAAAQLESQPPATPSEPPPTASERYSHCVFNREAVIAAHNEQFALQGPAISLTNQYGYEDPRSIKARADQQRAYERLEQLIPERMRAGQPLMPDSVEIFRSCERSAFFSQ